MYFYSQYIKRLLREADEEISELTTELEEDVKVRSDSDFTKPPCNMASMSDLSLILMSTFSLCQGKQFFFFIDHRKSVSIH